MQWEQVAWFCRSGEIRSSGSFNPCSPPEEAVRRFNQMREKDRELQEFQFFCEPWDGIPVVHAVARREKILAVALYVRGHGGARNFTVHTCGTTPEEVLEFFSQGGQWELAPWLV